MNYNINENKNEKIKNKNEKTLKEKVEEKTKSVKLTFYITYVFLLTTATITFIEALRTKDAKVRHILNLETCISVVAAFFYGRFVNEIKEGVDYKTINVTRYTDWAISTPLMLLVLCMVLGYENKLTVHFMNILYVLILNFLMLVGIVDWGDLGGISYTVMTLAHGNATQKQQQMLAGCF